ncbi:PadR family transcriptional regulator [Streptomyces collinus]|uniref:PadR family transcriptional regulator n=1 Tax=Streptomyces collinus TaxID=42684 RepID=UPI00382707E1
MTARLTRPVRRIVMALHIAGRPLTGGDLCRITCHWPGTVYPALDRLQRAGWIASAAGPGAVAAYQLTPHGQRHAGLTQPRR